MANSGRGENMIQDNISLDDEFSDDFTEIILLEMHRDIGSGWRDIQKCHPGGVPNVPVIRIALSWDLRGGAEVWEWFQTTAVQV